MSQPSSQMWNSDLKYNGLILGWDGRQWAYATPERWANDDGSRIIPAKEILGSLSGFDDPLRPPRCDHMIGKPGRMT